MTNDRRLATPINELTDEEIEKVGVFIYNDLKQTVTRSLLYLTTRGLKYDLMVDSMSLVLGELISMQVDGDKKVRRTEIELEVIERILDRGREMKIALDEAKKVPSIKQTVNEAFEEVNKSQLRD